MWCRMLSSQGPRAAKPGALSPEKVGFGRALDKLFTRVDAAAALWGFSHYLPHLINFAVIEERSVFWGES